MSEEGNSQNKGASNNQSREENKEEESPREENKENEEENKDNEEENKDNEEENKEEGEGEEEKKKEEPEGEPFSYLKKTKEVIWIKKKDEDKHFTTYKGTFKYSICILMENNDPLNSRFLKQTLRCIGNNLSKLNKDINIQAQEISLFIFINEIGYKNNSLDLNNLEIDNEEKNSEYILQEWMMDVENEEVKDLSNIKIFTINRLKYLYPVKALKFYYNTILRQIKIKKKIIFSSILTAGITFNESKLMEMISFSYHEKNKHGIAVSSIEYKDNNLISKLCTYETKRYNLYNMNYLSQSSSAPISSKLSTITINDKDLQVIMHHYKTLKKYSKASIYYHDYNLALNLRQKNFLIKYINDNPGIINTTQNFSFYDYQQLYLDRFQGHYGNFFQILSSFSNCGIVQIIFLIFQIISICFEFILPSITAMIIYIIYYSAFKTNDYRISLFFTLLYLSLMFASGYCSLVNKNINKMPNTYFIINILMAVLYLFSLVCSIPAMHFANKDKNPDLSGYKFNKAAISVIIILTFIPFIVPLIFKVSDAALLLVYNLVFSPFIKINFNVAAVWGASDVSGGKAIKERKSFYILLYLGINSFIGSLSFYNSDNKKKANCVMAFGIIYLVYNFVRSLAVVFEVCFKKEEVFENENLKKNIITDLNEKGEEGDIYSEANINQNEEGNENIEENNEENNEENKEENKEENNEDNINNEPNNDEQNNADEREVDIDQNDI
jgi:hypothetical protein